MNDLAAIHPDRLADVREQLGERPLWALHFAPAFDSSTVEAQAWSAALRSHGGHSYARRLFDQRIAGVLAAARSARLYHREELAQLGDGAGRESEDEREAFERTLTAVARKVRGVHEVDLDAPGIRADFDFWWFAVRYRGVLLGVPVKGLLATPALDGAEGPVYPSRRLVASVLPPSALDLARRESASGDIAFACLRVTTRGLDATFIAAPEPAMRIVEGVIVRQPLADLDRAWATQGTTRIIDPAFGYSYGRSLLEYLWSNPKEEPEAALVLRLERIDQLLHSLGDVLQTLGAAEGVAMMEGRPAPGLADRMVERSVAWNARQDPLQPGTIALALKAVQTIIDRSPVHQRLWRDTEAIGRWMTELAGLAGRLEAALRARRARVAAPNAVPLPSTRKPDEVLRAPLRRATMRFFALPSDAATLLRFAREQTGARLYAFQGVEPRELEPWELASVVPPEFAARTDERAHQRGLAVYVWWPEVCPEIQLYRERDPGIRELGIAPHGYVVPGWGIATLVFSGAVRERLLVSDFTYPTGAELRLPRYAGTGPWREVDWRALRRKVRSLRAAMSGPLAGGYAQRKEPIPVLIDAAARVAEGWTLAGELGGTTLPFTAVRGR